MTLEHITIKGFRNKMMQAAGAALLAATVACGGGNPGGPTPNPNPNPQPTTSQVRVSATETFSNSPINVEYTLEGCGQKVTGRTDGNPTSAPNCASYTLRVGMNGNNGQSDAAYVPSVFENVNISSDRTITTDLASSSRLFQSFEPSKVIEAYRGTGKPNAGMNGVWTTQPTAWRVYDPGRTLEKYSNPRDNADFNQIWDAWKSMCEDYTRNFIKMPSRESIELRIGEDFPQGAYLIPGVISFRISPPSNPYAIEAEESDASGSLISSAAASPQNDIRTAIGEAYASAQYAGNESLGFDTMFDGKWDRPGQRFGAPADKWQLHITWGEFNYLKRKPGDVMLPSGSARPSEFGFPYEKRKL